jgi:hypothetical protein
MLKGEIHSFEKHTKLTTNMSAQGSLSAPAVDVQFIKRIRSIHPLCINGR